jgi:hypothetical protein
MRALVRGVICVLMNWLLVDFDSFFSFFQPLPPRASLNEGFFFAVRDRCPPPT